MFCYTHNIYIHIIYTNQIQKEKRRGGGEVEYKHITFIHSRA